MSEPAAGAATADAAARRGPQEPQGPQRAPLAPLGRRLSSLLYEVVLLFGLMLVPAALATVFGSRAADAPSWRGSLAMQALSTAFFALYFGWFWSARGQTLPMQTWRIRLVRADGGPVGAGRALARYAAAYVGYLAPAWLVTQALDVHRGRALALHAAGVVCWALLARLDRDRQFWHDRVCGTRLVDVRGEPRRPAAR